jgi:enoyl-CoA hydratase/carnithine racemase
VVSPKGGETARWELWTLNRPGARNALDPELVESLHDEVCRAQGEGVRVVVLRGAGMGFSAGADLRHLLAHDPATDATPRAFLERIWDLTVAIERSRVVFVAALHGHAIAGGFELALACDVVMAARGTLIGDGHLRNGLVPGGGSSVRMTSALGPAGASWLGLTGALLPAEDPVFGPWLRALVEPAQLDATVEDVVADLLVPPADAQHTLKELLAAQRSSATTEQRARELDAFDRNWRDGVAAAHLRAFTTRPTRRGEQS